MKATPRKQKIVIERMTAVTDDYGHQDGSNWTPYITCYANVIYGSGREQREAAQLQASLPATFEVLSNDKTRSVTATDRIQFKSEAWNIIAPPNDLGLNDGVRIQAVRG